jgi:hypothetical protein
MAAAGGVGVGFTGKNLYQSKGELGERIDLDTAKTVLEDTFGATAQKMLDSGLLEIVESGGPDGIAGQYFGEEQKIKVMDDLYSELYPTVKKKDEEFYNDTLIRSIIAINQGDHQTLAKSQAKCGMLEYALGSYNSPNFIIYNSTTHDILSIKGKEGIVKSLDDPSNNVLATTATMGKSAKASAGVFLQTKDQNFLDTKFGFERKRKKTTKTSNPIK